MLTFFWNGILKTDVDRLIYKDKSVPQFDKEGNERSFKEVQILDNAQFLHGFELICQEDQIPHIAVDLVTGNFHIRGAIFHPYNALTTENNVRYRLVFYRRKRMVETNGVRSKPFVHRFLLGWQCTVRGLNYQRIMFYDPVHGSIEIKAKR